MKKLLLALALALALAPSPAWAQCTGIFGANTVCGTVAGGPPGQVAATSLSAGIKVGTTPVTNGTDTFLLYNNAGVLGNESLASILLSPPPIGNVAPNTGTFSYLLAAPSGSTSGGGNEYTPLASEVWSGSAIAPITTAQKPSMSISRFENITSGSNPTGENGPALWINNIATSSHQAVGLTSYVTNSAGAAAALYGVAITTGAEAAYGTFTNAIMKNTSGFAFAIETNTQNDSGADIAYNPNPIASTPTLAGFDIALNSTTTTKHGGGVAIQIRAIPTIKWDVGIGFIQGDYIGVASIQDNSQSPTIYLDKGTHTNGIDLSGGTYSGSPFKSVGFNINATGAISVTGTSGLQDSVSGENGAGWNIHNTYTQGGTADSKAVLHLQSDNWTNANWHIDTGDYDDDGSLGTSLNFGNGGSSVAIHFTALGGIGINTTADPGAGQIYTNDVNFLIRSKATYNNGASSHTATLTNAPAATNPTKWIPVDDNGVTRYIPAW